MSIMKEQMRKKEGEEGTRIIFLLKGIVQPTGGVADLSWLEKALLSFSLWWGQAGPYSSASTNPVWPPVPVHLVMKTDCYRCLWCDLYMAASDRPDKLIIKLSEYNNLEMWNGNYPDTKWLIKTAEQLLIYSFIVLALQSNEMWSA